MTIELSPIFLFNQFHGSYRKSGLRVEILEVPQCWVEERDHISGENML